MCRPSHTPTALASLGRGTQLDQIDAQLGDDFAPSLVVVSLGGNDVGFCDEGDLWRDNVGTLEET
jgi:hypothetical protein